MATKQCWLVLIVLPALVLLLPLVSPRIARADDAQIKMILERLEQVERQNQILKKTVEEQQQLLKQRPALGDPAVALGAASGSSQPPIGDKAVEKIVDDYLTQKEKEKKVAEAAKADSGDKSWDVGKNLKMEGSWKNGLQFSTPDKAFTFAVGGVIQFDMGWFGANQSTVNSIGTFNNLVDPNQTLQDGMDFRRARLRMGGTAYEQIEYFAQYEFASSLDQRQRTLGIANPGGIANPNVTNFDPSDTVLFNEVYIGLIKVPHVGNVRVGRHRESLNFVTATNDNNQVWMERGLMFEGFNSNYNFSNGVTVSNTYCEDRAYTLFGFFQQNNNNNRAFTNVGDGDYVYDGRFCFLPLWNEQQQHWVHLGVDYSYRNLYQDYVRDRGRPDLRIGSAFQVPNIVDSGNVFSRDAQQIANLEFATAWGRWTASAEGTVSWITNAYTGGLPGPTGKLPAGAVRRGTYFAEGAYVELLYFLTPDHRGYVKERPGYARVSPKENFFYLKGEDGRSIWSRGAWEVGARYDYLDLTNSGINGGTAQGVTFCFNWYLSSNCRVQANYIWMTRDFSPEVVSQGRTSGEFDGFGLRFNCDF